MIWRESQHLNLKFPEFEFWVPRYEDRRQEPIRRLAFPGRSKEPVGCPYAEGRRQEPIRRLAFPG